MRSLSDPPTPTEVRNAIRYVLLNGNRHEVEHGAKQLWYGVDRFSSGAWFDGWADERWQHEASDRPCVTVAPQTWLLATGWRRSGGPIAFDDTPGPEARVRLPTNLSASRPTARAIQRAR